MTEPADGAIRILLVEDNPGDARLIEKMLARVRPERFDFITVDRLTAGLRRLDRGGIDVVLLDLSLPDSDGLDTFVRVRAQAPRVPIVVLSGLEDEELALRAVHEGAQDYLVKRSLVADVVVRSIRYAIERKRAEEALRESEENEKFKKIFESSFDGIAINSYPEGRFVEVNGPFLELSGFSREEVLGRTPVELGMWADPQALAQALEEVRLHGFVRNFEAEFHRKDGTTRATQGSMVVLEVGNRPSLFSFIRDVTEQKQAAMALFELSGRLLRSEDEERRRIARELHDSTAQNLSALALDLGRLGRSASALPAGFRQGLEQSLALAKQCLGEIRTVSYLLHPPLLDELGLALALRRYVRGFSERSGIRVALKASSNLGRLPREIETTIFRIVQESLTNIHRHSGSATASIRIVRKSGTVAVEVTDQGRGMAPGILTGGGGFVPGFGVGIAAMQERLRPLGGHLNITSSDRGVTVSAVLPRTSRSA